MLRVVQIGKPTFLQALISAGQLAEPKFALRLGQPGADYVAGEITLGSANPPGAVTTVPVPEGINDVCPFSFFRLQRHWT